MDQSPPGPGTLLHLEQVSKSFKGLAALHAVTLDVMAGEIVGLIGPNGAGKSTLFNLIGGAYAPDSGRITFQGRDITRAAPHQRCWLGIARTFQTARPFPRLTLLQNVAVGRVYGRLALKDRRQAEAEGQQILAGVGLIGREVRRARGLNNPDRKRLELGRALAAHPRLLLLDEALAGLDASDAQAVLELVRRQRASGVSAILVEHHIQALFGVADRIVVLNAGEKIFEGPPQAAGRDPGVIEAYLGKAWHAPPGREAGRA